MKKHIPYKGTGEPDGNLIQHIEGAGKPEERLFQLLL